MSQQQRTVLIVDDSPEDCELYQRYLRRDRDYNYKFVQAELGRLGVELWQQHQPDIVLLDYLLPDLDGIEFLTELQTITHQSFLPVIVVTGQGNEAIAVEAIKAGAQNYLVKGAITQERLRVAVNGAIDNVQLRTQLQQTQEKERLIAQITSKIYKSLNLNEIMQTIVSEVRQFLHTDRAIIFQLHGDGNGEVVAESVGAQWVSIMAYSMSDPCLAEDYIERYRQGLLNLDPTSLDEYIERYRQGLVTVKTDIYDGTIDACHVELLAQFQVRANLVVPIVHDQYFWGILIAHHCRAPRQWQQLDINLLQELATHVSIAIRQAKALEQAQNELAERQRAEASLQESEGRLRLALKASRMGTWDWNILTGEITWSDNLEALFGLEPGEFDGSFAMFSSRIHPEDRDRVLESVNAAVTTGADYNIEFRVAYPNGRIRWALSQGKVFYDSTGQPVRMAGVDLDITERKRSETELRENQAWLKLGQKATKSGLWDWDLTTNKAKITEDYCSIFGLDLAMQEISFEDWLRLVHLDDRTQINEYNARIIQEKQEDYEIEYRIQHPNGIRWLLAKAKIFYNVAGNAVRVFGNVQDISDRKLAEELLKSSEERLQLSLEGSGNGLWDWNIVTDELYLSPRWLEMLGYEVGELPNHVNSWKELIYPEDKSWTLEILEAHLLDSSVPYKFDYRVLTKSGEVKWIANYGKVVLRDEHGQPLRMAGIHQDISDRKLAEEELQLKAQILAQTHDSVVSTDLDGYITSWNQGAQRVFGYSAQETIGQHIELLYPQPQMRDALQNQIIAPLKAKGEHEVEVKAQAKCGKHIDVLLSLSLLRDRNQNPVGMIGFSMDITARKLAEAELRQSEEFNQRMLSSSSDCIKVLDLDGRLLYMNPGGICLLEIDDLAPLLNTEWLCFWGEQAQQMAQDAIAVAKAGELGRFQGYCPTAKGTPKWWDVVVTPIRNPAGQIIQLLCISRDITDYKQAEEAIRQSEARYRYLAEAIPHLVWTCDANGLCDYVNERLCEYTGLPFEQALDFGWLSAVHPEDVELSQNIWLNAVKNSTFYKHEYRFRRNSDGSYRWHLILGLPLKDEQGRVMKWFGTCTDIHDQKELEIERDRILQLEQVARNEAERANRIKDEFLAILSHELRSPLNPILGWTKLLQSRKLDDSKTAEALATIERNAKLQTQLIDDLLDIARILRGKLSLNADPLNLAFVIEAAIDTVRTAAIAKSILIHPVLPNIGQVSGDAVRLQQIVWNLLSNAIKFTPSGGRVDIVLERVGKQAQITVADTGKGINQEFLPHIFESFRQEDVSVTRKYGGLGLGLAIVYHLIEAHGGTITADSQGEGQGATFTVRLPLLHIEPESDRAVELSADALNLTGIKVLTIDDEPDSRDLMAFLLAEYGAEVMTVASSEEFFAALESFEPDIIVSDIGMPEVDGYTLLRQVRTLPPERGGKLPAIALTAYAGEINQQQALEAGFQRHLSKPINPDVLVQAVAQLIREQ
ncbi:multi-sensor hybrid histidine kinase [Calothrix sp. NIES-2100]|uniref:PAS domain-containing protein n=1 Tax=Calothrix sp. NIES-2100 TaxID=1954172 RepID=UPI000B5FDA9C|nr:multi-sensor hybrid histidine kinase [Calothrix sp. NIES-2100]